MAIRVTRASAAMVGGNGGTLSQESTVKDARALLGQRGYALRKRSRRKKVGRLTGNVEFGGKWDCTRCRTAGDYYFSSLSIQKSF